MADQSTRAAALVVAGIHLRFLHHSLDPLGIALAALAVALAIVATALIASKLVGRTRHTGRT